MPARTGSSAFSTSVVPYVCEAYPVTVAYSGPFLYVRSYRSWLAGVLRSGDALLADHDGAARLVVTGDGHPAVGGVAVERVGLEDLDAGRVDEQRHQQHQTEPAARRMYRITWPSPPARCGPCDDAGFDHGQRVGGRSR